MDDGAARTEKDGFHGTEFLPLSLEEKRPYMLGGLLYMPAFQENIVQKLIQGSYPSLRSIAFCLEDTIQDEALEKAERKLKEILGKIRIVRAQIPSLPMIFIRVRTPEHLESISEMFEEESGLLTGYILPKFDLQNAEDYLDGIRRLNARSGQRKYIMPVLESALTADLRCRADHLLKIRDLLDSVRDLVLNVRVGGNDLSGLFGLRRDAGSTIYEIGAVRDILIDVVSVFSKDYVVSGPVWEYFGKSEKEPWAEGLRRELRADRLSGFIGKTAIHPCQLPVIEESLQVSRSDYEDARRICSFNGRNLAVEKSFLGNRMNELKCHGKWARKILLLGSIYGVREEGEGDA